jgi:glycosyltransferase involved in cell wall biosynthesis
MKMAMLIPAYYPWIGGAEVFAQNVAEYMVQKGHEVDVITGLWDKPSVFTSTWNARHEVINGVDIYRTRTINIKNIKSLSCMLPIACKTIELDKIKNYDIIHSHIFPAIQSGTIVKKLRKKINLVTVQGGELVDYPETTGKFGGVLKPLVSWGIKNADMVHAVSTHMERGAKELGAKRTIVIPNGVDVQEFRPLNRKKLRAKHQISFEERLIISISRLTEKNGIDYLIKAVARLETPNVKLLTVGNGDQRSYLETLIRDLNMGGKVKMLGSVLHEKIPEYLNIADIFVRPSLAEGFGIAFIEATACGTPVIGTNVGGIPDIIDNEINGLLVAPANVEELAGAIDRLLGDEGLRGKFVKNGIETAKRKFTWKTVLARVEKLYGDLLGG